MGPHTLQALQAELDQLTARADIAPNDTAYFQAPATQEAVLRFRIQMLRAMLREVEPEAAAPSEH